MVLLVYLTDREEFPIQLRASQDWEGIYASRQQAEPGKAVLDAAQSSLRLVLRPEASAPRSMVL